MNNEEYRKELILRIKETGQEIIDRAEQMVGENVDNSTEVTIYLSFDPSMVSELSTLEWTTTTLNENTYKRMLGE